MIENVLDRLAWLIAMDTVEQRGAMECLALIAEYLTPYACEVHLCDVQGGRNLIAHFGADKAGGLMLAGHVDVVPVDNQIWSCSPFVARREAGRIFGRGACDMKGFVACLLGLAPHFAKNAHNIPVTICLTPDEETNFTGAGMLPTQLAALNMKPAGALVGEPTEMAIGTTHPGFVDMTSRYVGTSAHSARQDLGVNAIYAAAEFVTHLQELDRTFASKGSRISVGLMSGGNARNIVPEVCEVEWEIRHQTALPAPGLREAVQALKTESSARRTDRVERSVSGLVSDPACAFLAHIRTVLPDLQTVKLPFATEAGLYQAAGIPALVMGPGSIEQAHKPDEFVEILQLQLCVDALQKLMFSAQAR